VSRVRIIGGTWRRRLLPVLDRPGLRPTPDRVRETVFNWLDHLLEKPWGETRAIDLFAGTGALGLEAASRGVASCTLVESDGLVHASLQASIAGLHAQDAIELIRGDGIAVLRAQPNASIDLVFLDPPYGTPLLGQALAVCHPKLSAGGLCYLESNQPLEELLASEWRILRSAKAGDVHYGLASPDASEQVMVEQKGRE